MEITTISIIPRDKFSARMQLEEEFGKVLHDQLTALLDVVGEEQTQINNVDIRLGVYLDSSNEGTRYFKVSPQAGNLIYDHFGHSFSGELKAFALREQQNGTNLLFQLNSGDISTKDFENKF